MATCLKENQDLLAGLASLRRAGDQAADIVARVLALPQLRSLPASWDLWRALAQSEGIDVDCLLAEYLPAESILVAKEALWGHSGKD